MCNRRSLSLLLVLVGFVATACDEEVSGPPNRGVDTDNDETLQDSAELEVGRTGDLPTEGGATLEADLSGSPIECGVPNFPAGTPLRRAPYVQSVTSVSARIAWTSAEETAGVVEFANARRGFWQTTEATVEAFPVTRTGAADDYWAFDATLDGLSDGERYWYRVRAGEVVLAEGLTFDAAWSDPERPVRILAFGDSGNGSAEQMAVRDRFMTREFDLFLHLGDMAYGSGTHVEFEAHVFDVYADLLHRVPTWPTLGNHEISTANGQPYLDVYYLPEQARRTADQERYYSFDYGDIHFVSVESNDYPLLEAALDPTNAFPDDMIDWLRDDLAASTATWKVAYFHHPPYSSSERDPNHQVRTLLVPALENGGVDLVLVGHDHHYERTLPLLDGVVAADDRSGLTYVVAGMGGAGLRPAFGDWFTAEVTDQNHGFLSLVIAGCEAHGEMVASDGTVVDDFTVNGCD